MNKRFGYCLAFGAAIASLRLAASTTEMFPFVISYDAPQNIANMRSLLDAPAGRNGRITVKDGHFATEKGPVRFNAINLTGPANFPSPEYAERLANRLARFGINCVRLHFLDCQKGYGSFMQSRQACLLKDGDNPFKWEFDEKQFDRLDWLAACLKRRGIYVNVNLHVARFMSYLQKDRQSLKGLTWLDPEIIASQKDFARAFLAHRNPYTGLTWAEDPVVAMIELNNEDAAFDACYKSVREGNERFVRYIAEAEKRYLTEMKRFIREEVGCLAPLAGTQLTYTSCHVNGVLDYLDAHEYWCHPSPVRAEWTVLDAPQVNHPAANCVAWLASRKVRGYPFTVSEYNNPYPNRTGSEGSLLMHAYGAYHGWDGIFLYSYDNRVDSEPDHVEYFFSLASRTEILAHLPACAALYLRGDVKPARRSIAVAGSYKDYLGRFARDKIIFDDVTQSSGGKIPYGAGLLTGLELVLDGEGNGSLEPVGLGRRFVSDTGELEWNVELEDAGYVAVRTKQTKIFTGFVRNRTVDLGDGVVLRVGDTRRDWASVSLMSKLATGMGGGGCARILLAATGLAHNTGAVFTEHQRNKHGEVRISSRGDDWGKGPYLVEGISAKIDLPAQFCKTKCWALDERGDRRDCVDIDDVGGCASISISPKYRTVWYEIEISP